MTSPPSADNGSFKGALESSPPARVPVSSRLCRQDSLIQSVQTGRTYLLSEDSSAPSGVEMKESRGHGSSDPHPDSSWDPSSPACSVQWGSGGIWSLA